MSSKIVALWSKVAGFALAVSIASVGQAQESRGIVRISVPGLGSMYTMPFQIAQEQNFYRAEGLDVRILGGVKTAPSVQMLVGGNVEVTQTVGTTTLAAILQGAPLKVVMVFNDKPTYALYAKKSIRSFAELKGAKVASITPGSTGDRVLAAMAFLTLFHPLSRSKRRRVVLGPLIALVALTAVELGRAFIPPAPLRLAGAEFGTDFQRETLNVIDKRTALPSGPSARLYGLTSIKASLGLEERVQHRWYQNGKLIWASPFYSVTGGREEGFRLWTACNFEHITLATEIRLDVETEGGQLIGRAVLKAAKGPAAA